MSTLKSLDVTWPHCVWKGEFVTMFRQFKTNLAQNNLGGPFFKAPSDGPLPATVEPTLLTRRPSLTRILLPQEHLIDLTTDYWDDANPEAVPPPVLTPNNNYTTGDRWHCLGAIDQAEKEVAEAKKQAAAEKRAGKKKKIQKDDDFNFARIFAARQAGYKGVVG